MGKQTEQQRRERVAAYAREALRRKGMSQKALTEATGLDKGTVSAFFTGHRWPNADTLDRIERALELPDGSLARLHDGTGPDEPSALSPVASRVGSSAVHEERGELSGRRVVRVHIATMAHDIDIQTTLDDGEDRASVLAEIMGTLGLEGDASRGGSTDGGS